ncbi:MAG: Maf family protein [Chloroflexota bacterium]|nr:Maf family protein [Chloroflexota bacterium]
MFKSTDEEKHAPSLVLASASPRRRELLSRLGVPFEVRPVGADEAHAPGETPWQHARRVALLKLACARRTRADEAVLVADTIVELDGVALGKPRSGEEAVRMLEALRGRSHAVHTAVAIGAQGIHATVVCTTQVTMRHYSDEDLHAYVATGEPLDKAGAYAIQDEHFAPVSQVHGSYSNVVGLPLAPTARLLRLVGYEVTSDDRYAIRLKAGDDGHLPHSQHQHHAKER